LHSIKVSLGDNFCHPVIIEIGGLEREVVYSAALQVEYRAAPLDAEFAPERHLVQGNAEIDNQGYQENRKKTGGCNPAEDPAGKPQDDKNRQHPRYSQIPFQE